MQKVEHIHRVFSFCSLLFFQLGQQVMESPNVAPARCSVGGLGGGGWGAGSEGCNGEAGDALGGCGGFFAGWGSAL